MRSTMTSDSLPEQVANVLEQLQTFGCLDKLIAATEVNLSS